MFGLLGSAINLVGGLFTDKRNRDSAREANALTWEQTKKLDRLGRDRFLADRNHDIQLMRDERDHAQNLGFAMRDEQRAYDAGAMLRLRDQAAEAGFNPLTALGSGALGAGVSAMPGVAPLALNGPQTPAPLQARAAVVPVSHNFVGDFGRDLSSQQRIELENDLLRVQIDQARAQVAAPGKGSPAGTRAFGARPGRVDHGRPVTPVTEMALPDDDDLGYEPAGSKPISEHRPVPRMRNDTKGYVPLVDPSNRVVMVPKGHADILERKAGDSLIAEDMEAIGGDIMQEVFGGIHAPNIAVTYEGSRAGLQNDDVRKAVGGSILPKVTLPSVLDGMGTITGMPVMNRAADGVRSVREWQERREDAAEKGANSGSRNRRN